MLKPAIIILALVATPALAQEKLDHVATTVAGIGEGATIAVSPSAFGPVTKTGDGSWEVATNDGLASFLVTEPEECLFELTYGIGGAPQAILRFNFNLSTGVDFTAKEPMNGLNQFEILLLGEGDLVQFSPPPGGQFSTVPPGSTMATSLPIEDVEAAAAALEQACPKP